MKNVRVATSSLTCRYSLALAVALIAFCFSGCASRQVMLDNAKDLSAAFEAQLGERDEAYMDLLKAFALARLEERDKRFEAEFNVKKLTELVALYDEIEKRREQLAESAVEKFKGAMQPVLARLENDLETAQDSRAPLEEEFRKAAELSATLAFSANELEKIREAVDSAFKEARKEIEEKIKAISYTKLTKEERQKLVDEIFADPAIAQSLAKYEEDLKTIFAAYQKFIERPSDLVAFVKGFVGEKKFGEISDALKSYTGLDLSKLPDLSPETIFDHVTNVGLEHLKSEAQKIEMEISQQINDAIGDARANLTSK